MKCFCSNFKIKMNKKTKIKMKKSRTKMKGMMKKIKKMNND